MKYVHSFVALCVLASPACDREKAAGEGRAADDPATGEQRPGHELLGRTMPDWQLSDWVGGEPRSLRDLRGRVVVVRFWTTGGCPYCERSMPALQRLADEYRDAPVTIVGAYHDKPSGSAADMSEAIATAREWGVSFSLAWDREWRTLRSWWLDGHRRDATSVTFVIGADGKVAHVHPGPVFFPSQDSSAAGPNRDFIALRAAIRDAVDHARPGPRSPPE